MKIKFCLRQNLLVVRLLSFLQAQNQLVFLRNTEENLWLWFVPLKHILCHHSGTKFNLSTLLLHHEIKISRFVGKGFSVSYHQILYPTLIALLEKHKSYRQKLNPCTDTKFTILIHLLSSTWVPSSFHNGKNVSLNKSSKISGIISEPVGSAIPKFSSKSNLAAYQENALQTLALTCPAQGSPLPSFR